MIEVLAGLLGALLGGAGVGLWLQRRRHSEALQWLEGLPVPAAALDRDGALVIWNAAAQSLFEERPSALYDGVEHRLRGGRSVHWSSAPVGQTGLETVLLGAVVERIVPEVATQKGTEPEILVIDDDRLIRSFLRRGLSRKGLQPVLARCGDEGLALLDARPSLHAVLLDLSLPDISGEEVLAEIRIRRPGLPVILMTGRELDRLESVGADGLLQKPFQIADVVALIDSSRGQ